MLSILYTRAGQDSRLAMLERMGKSTAERCILLVPEQYSHESERAMCKVLGNGVSRRCEVLSFTRLARRLSDTYGGSADTMMDAGSQMLLMYAALRQVAPELSFYKTPSRKPAFLNKLLTTVEECRNYCVEPAVLIALGEEQKDQQGDKWRDIGLIYDAYLGLWEETDIDLRSVLDRLAKQLKNHPWADGMDIFIHGFMDFTPVQEEIILTLAERANVTLALTLDRDDSLSGIFQTAERTVSRLKRKTRVDEEILSGYQKYETPALAFLERHLFGSLPEPMTGADGVTRVKCGDPRREVEWAAGEILHLVRDQGYRYREIGVCARKLGSYGELIESTFEHFGIPVFESTMDDVLQNPLLTLVTSALAAVAGDYSCEDMLRYLKTDLTGIGRDDRDLLENYVITWNLRGAAWLNEKLWHRHPEGYGLTLSEREQRRLAHLNRLREQVIAPLETLRKDSDETGRGRVLALYRFLTDIDLPRRMEHRAEKLEKEGKLAAAAECRQLWDIVVNAMEQTARHLEDTKLEREEFSRLFSLVLSQYSVGTIPVYLDAVTVGDAHRMAHKAVKVLFFLGADSTAIPCCEPDAGLLSDRDREALSKLQVELAPGQEEKLQRELTLVYETCSIPSQKLYLSYALTAGGEERTASFLWERLEALFPDCKEQLAGESRLAAPLPALELAGRNPALAKELKKIEVCMPGVERLEKAAIWRRGSLTAEGVKRLFGAAVPMSATKLDLLNSCHFGHFMRFGLGAKPRREAKFRPTEYGTFVHEVLERVLMQAEEHGGIAVLAQQDELRRALAGEAADQFVQSALPDMEDESARFRYLFDRMKTAALAVTDSVVAELAVSDFVPAQFELGFGEGEPLPPVEVENGMTLRLSGFVDRVDQWMHNGKRYLRVVDYKTGKKSFSFSDVEDGRGLQMLLYLFALARSGKKLFGDEEIVPAGVLYIPARNPVVNGERSMEPAEVEKLQADQLRRQGLVLNDSEVLQAMERTQAGYRFLPVKEGRNRSDYLVDELQMAMLDEYVTATLEKAAGELAEGNINADPFWHDDNHNACRWCDFKAACHFEECCGDQRRRRKNLSSAAFWDHMKRRKGGAGHGD